MRSARLVSIAIVAATAMAFSAAPAFAAAGDLDPTFGGDGRVTTNLSNNDGAWDVAVQSDGKIVAVGGATDEFAVVRYDRDGTLDTGFGHAGIAKVRFAGLDSFGASAVGLFHGQILVAGTVENSGGTERMGIARLNSNGSLDTAFGHNGGLTVSFASGASVADLAIQGDGRIVVLGSLQGKFEVARITAAGALDTTFSGDGTTTITFPGGSAVAAGIAIDHHTHTIAVVGQQFLSQGGEHALIAVLHTNGTLDTGFSGDGEIVGTSDAAANTVVATSNDDFVWGGSGVAGSGFQVNFRMVAYHQDGTLDHSFSDGIVSTAFAGDGRQRAIILGLAVDASGRLVAAGLFDDQGPGIFALARYTAHGALDTSFSVNGKLTTAFPADAHARAVAINRGTGKIVAAGIETGSSNSVFALTRYLGS